MLTDRRGHRHGASALQGGLTFIRKRFTEAIPNDTATQDDDDFHFNVVAGGMYAFECVLLVKSVINDTFTYQWLAPAGATFQIQSSTPAGVVQLTETSGDDSISTVAGVTSMIHFVGTIMVGATAGVFKLVWN